MGVHACICACVCLFLSINFIFSVFIATILSVSFIFIFTIQAYFKEISGLSHAPTGTAKVQQDLLLEHPLFYIIVYAFESFSQIPSHMVSHIVTHTHVDIYIKINTKDKTIWSFLSSVFKLRLQTLEVVYLHHKWKICGFVPHLDNVA